MTPELQSMLDQVEAIKLEGQAVTAGLSEAQFNWRPRKDSWSIAECLEHLNVGVTTALPAFDRAIAQGREQRKTAPGDGAVVRDQLAERVRQADGLDLARVRTISPVNSLLRLPLGAYFNFILAHDRRHLWQARQVRNAPGFGTS